MPNRRLELASKCLRGRGEIHESALLDALFRAFGGQELEGKEETRLMRALDEFIAWVNNRRELPRFVRTRSREGGFSFKSLG